MVVKREYEIWEGFFFFLMIGDTIIYLYPGVNDPERKFDNVGEWGYKILG